MLQFGYIINCLSLQCSTVILLLTVSLKSYLLLVGLGICVASLEQVHLYELACATKVPKLN